ncbi:rhodanese-like domain-containing protein [Salegentibacter flavus]|uniref:Glyoxylase, beta-lactamase superfamily II n=1 Tax=Salegentibacter flavus TaxID=287099 RepID=A0A1I5BQG1_9FLAO|nr:rhodanese-like domain-containing protein [Salegentibacter flavus]SFN76908.1 Glyoxylase, beta-lactamase superfamily II [Salegentibacter flavus]
MKIKQFKDEPLAHYSYALVSNGEMALVDPSRNPMPYYKYAEENNAKIVAVFETHPHADFVSSHLQIHKETGATIYISEMVGVSYPHTGFDEGQSVKIGGATVKPLHTPGHSPDSLTFIAEENGETAMFSGDTLFIGNVGRPDLREKAGNMKAKRVELAKAMYKTMQSKFNDLPDDTIVYPAHGAGSLCGKNMSDASSSTLGNERQGNWAFRDQTEEEFVEEILKDQPFIPAYFGFNVDVNRKGAMNVQKAKYSVPVKLLVESLEDDAVVVDSRGRETYREGHLPNSINIMGVTEEDKLETWLGAIIAPEEPFYMVVKSVDDMEDTLERIAKIGYEQQMKGIVTLSEKVSLSTEAFDHEDFKKNRDKYTVVDARNEAEVETDGKFIEGSLNIPLNELRNRADEVPTGKPVVVHCAGGFRSAAGSSILETKLKDTKVYDFSEDIEEYKAETAE